MGRKRESKKKGAARKAAGDSSNNTKKAAGGRAQGGGQHRADIISNLPDDILAHILSLVAYIDAVRASATCRRWKNLHLQLPHVHLCFESRGPAAMQSMERMLRHRRRDQHNRRIQRLRVVYGADVPAERDHAARFIKLAAAPVLEVWAGCVCRDLPDGGAGAWSLDLPLGTAELTLWTADFAIRLPDIHGLGVVSLKTLTLEARLVLRWDTLAALRFPFLEDLSIVHCTLAAGAGMAVTSAAMPRLRRLRITDVTIADAGRPGSITVDAEELDTLHMSCRLYGAPLRRRRGETQWATYRRTPFPRAGHTVYASVLVRAPRLRVLAWRVCWAYEVRIESVGRLSDVAVELAYGEMPMISPEEKRTITREEAHALMASILAGLSPGLRHLGIRFKQLERDVCELREEQKLLCEISSEDDDLI